MSDIGNDPFFHENIFYKTAPVGRISKFVTHLDLYRKSLGVPGEIVECGVFRGNSLFKWIKFRSLLENTTSRRIVAFDTFGEFPESAYEIDQERRAAFIDETKGGKSASIDEIRDALQALNLSENVELVKGDILQTVSKYVANKPYLRISLLHIDVDLYEPTKVALECLYPLVSKGGVLILDDYGAMPGANKAIDEYFRDKDVVIEKLGFSHAITFAVKNESP